MDEQAVEPDRLNWDWFGIELETVSVFFGQVGYIGSQIGTQCAGGYAYSSCGYLDVGLIPGQFGNIGIQLGTQRTSGYAYSSCGYLDVCLIAEQVGDSCGAITLRFSPFSLVCRLGSPPARRCGASRCGRRFSRRES